MEQLCLTDKPGRKKEKKREGEKKRERKKKKTLCGLYTAWILNKERPQLVLVVTPLRGEQVTDRAFVIVCVLRDAGN